MSNEKNNGSSFNQENAKKIFVEGTKMAASLLLQGMLLTAGGHLMGRVLRGPSIFKAAKLGDAEKIISIKKVV